MCPPIVVDSEAAFFTFARLDFSDISATVALRSVAREMIRRAAQPYRDMSVAYRHVARRDTNRFIRERIEPVCAARKNVSTRVALPEIFARRNEANLAASLSQHSTARCPTMESDGATRDLLKPDEYLPDRGSIMMSNRKHLSAFAFGCLSALPGVRAGGV